jgi:hypothetical protein
MNQSVGMLVLGCPQGLKPRRLFASNGTAEAVPFQTQCGGGTPPRQPPGRRRYLVRCGFGYGALLDFTADQEQEKNSQDRVDAHETEQSEYSVAG